VFFNSTVVPLPGDVLTLILNDALTPKSFEDIQYTMKTMREQEYLNLRLQYESAVDYYCANKSNRRKASSFAPFSEMDDKRFYNVQPHVPSVDYIIKIFKRYVQENKAVMEAVMDDVPPFPVLSGDHTFNIAKRVKEQAPIPPPEHRPPGPPPAQRYESVKESAVFCVMGANGMVSVLY